MRPHIFLCSLGNPSCLMGEMGQLSSQKICVLVLLFIEEFALLVEVARPCMMQPKPPLETGPAAKAVMYEKQARARGSITTLLLYISDGLCLAKGIAI